MTNNADVATDSRRGVDYIGVNCCFFCHDGNGRILLHKRSANCRDEVGCWDNGAGAMEFGETFEEAVRRELKEEFNVTPKHLQLCDVVNVLRDNQGTPTHWVAAVFVAEIDPAEVKVMEPHKVEEIGWFTFDNLPQPLHSMTLKHLDTIRSAGVKI